MLFISLFVKNIKSRTTKGQTNLDERLRRVNEIFASLTFDLTMSRAFPFPFVPAASFSEIFSPDIIQADHTGKALLKDLIKIWHRGIDDTTSNVEESNDNSDEKKTELFMTSVNTNVQSVVSLDDESHHFGTLPSLALLKREYGLFCSTMESPIQDSSLWEEPITLSFYLECLVWISRFSQ